MSISYLLPEKILADAVTTRQIPDSVAYTKPSFPGTIVKVTTGDWGIMIHTYADIAGLMYSEFYCKPLKDLQFEIHTTGGCITHQAVHSGRMSVSGPGKGMLFRAGMQSLHYVPENAIYYAGIPAGTEYHSTVLIHDPAVIREIESYFPKIIPLSTAYTAGVSKHISGTPVRLKFGCRQIMAQIKDTRLKEGALNVYYRSKLTDCLLQYLQQLHHHPVTEVDIIFSKQSEIQQLITEIKNNPESAVNITGRAKNIGLPSRLLQKAFKQAAGTSIRSFTMMQRIEKSKKLLRDTAYTVNDIAAIVGFVGGNYFARIFKEQTGITPMQYKSENT